MWLQVNELDKYKVIWFRTSHDCTHSGLHCEVLMCYRFLGLEAFFHSLVFFGDPIGQLTPFLGNKWNKKAFVGSAKWLLRPHCLTPNIPPPSSSSSSSSVPHTHMLILSVVLSSTLLLLLFRWPQSSAVPLLLSSFSFSYFSPVSLLFFAHSTLLSWLSMKKTRAGRLLGFSHRHMLSITGVSGMVSTS